MEIRVNDLVIHSDNGACTVLRIEKHDKIVASSMKQYYILSSVNDPGCKISVPIENASSIVRRVISKSEAAELLDRTREVGCIHATDYKKTKERHLNLLKTYNAYVWLSMVKTLYRRNQKTIAENKSVDYTKHKYLNKASDMLFGELALSLGITVDRAKEYVLEKLRADDRLYGLPT